LTCGCDEAGRPRLEIVFRNEGGPEPDEAIQLAIEDALQEAQAWIGWDGGAVLSRGNAWTPHKALRRITDHLVDHLYQVEARVAGEAPIRDEWRGRSITLDSDWARFTEQDLDEGAARVRRLAQVLAWRVRALEAQWDAPAGKEWTIRVIAEHLAEATAAYASRPRGASPNQRNN
jgi:hypothetical protein